MITRSLICLFLFWIGCMPISIQAQKIISTTSGQYILIQPDYTYEVIIPDAEKGTVDVFENPDAKSTRLLPEQVNRISKVKNELQELEVTARVQLESLYDDIQALDYQLSKAKENNDTDAFLSLRSELRHLEENREILADLQDESASLIEALEKLRDSRPKNFEKKFNKILATANKKINTQYELIEETETPSLQVITTDSRPSMSTAYAVNKTTFPRYTPGCKIAYDDYDASLKKDRKTLAPEPIFSYTHPRLKPVFKTENFLDAEAYLSRIGKNNYLVINVRLHSKDAGNAYGAVRKGEMVRIHLIGPHKVYGYATYSTQGDIEPYSGDMVYELIYLLEDSDVKKLEDYPIKDIGIVWTSGYEQYEVYDVDILQRQARCL